MHREFMRASATFLSEGELLWMLRMSSPNISPKHYGKMGLSGITEMSVPWSGELAQPTSQSWPMVGGGDAISHPWVIWMHCSLLDLGRFIGLSKHKSTITHEVKSQPQPSRFLTQTVGYHCVMHVLLSEILYTLTLLLNSFRAAKLLKNKCSKCY